MFVALSRFIVANDLTPAIKNAFCNRPHLVDSAPGFLRMEVLSPQDNCNEIWLLTYWLTQQDYEIWHRSHAYHESHRGIPKGLKLVPKSTEIRFFDHVAS
jgi:heme-degrading monooxygenase HmoA